MKVISLFVVMFSVSKKLLRGYWTPIMSNQTCPQIQWTCEHVIPKSRIDEHDDLINWILYPSCLNHARSNYPYINNNTMNGTIKMIYPCSQKNCSCISMTGQLVSKKFFIPPNYWKGMISRSVLTMVQKYPHHRSLINQKVLDLTIASLWNQTFPMTDEEKDWQSLLNGRLHK